MKLNYRFLFTYSHFLRTIKVCWILLLTFLLSCNEAIIELSCNEAIIEVNDLSEPSMINKWQVIGAFPLSSEKGLLNDELERYNLSERSATIEQLTTLEIDTLSGFSKRLVNIEGYSIDFYKHFPIPDSTTSAMFAYAYCIVKSNKEQTLMLNYASNSGSVIWLNNKILLEEKYTIYKRFTYAQKYIPINLRKGNNLLLVKVRNDGKDWKMFAAIENFTEQGQRRHNILSVMDNYGNIMNSCMVENDTLEFGWWMPSNYYGDFNIRGKGVDTTFSVNSRPNDMNISFLEDGFYRLSLFMVQDTIVQHFFKGDFHKAFTNKLTILSKMDLDPLTRKNVEAYEFRYSHLLKPAHLPQMSYEIPDWKRKLMFLFKGINIIYENSINKERSSVPNINSYISKIDSSVQYYQLFAPNDYSKDEPLPLIVQLPVPVKRFKPYLATYHFADIDGSDLLSYVANKFNAIILKANFRTVDITNGNTLDEFDLWENIEAVKNLYNIDTSKISLIGTCESAFYALRIGAKYPERIAAMSLVSPRLAGLNGRGNPWVLQQNPINILSNLWDTPILNIHSKLDEHTKIENSYYLNELINKEKLTKYEYRELPLDFEPFYLGEYIEDLVKFNLRHSISERKLDELRFTAYQLKNSTYYWLKVIEMDKMGAKITVHAIIKDNTLEIKSDNVNRIQLDLGDLPYNANEKLKIVHNNKVIYEGYTDGDELTVGVQNGYSQGLVKNSLIEGPFVHVFLQPFIIVPGTIGDQKEIQLNNTIATQLAEMWDTMYYAKCHVVIDQNISENEIQNFNLILIGNEHNNKLLKQHNNIMPIRNTSNSVVINNEHFQGENLNYYMVYPNPARTDNYIAVLGYNNADRFLLMSENDISPLENISYLGYYDYKVWTPNKVIHKGYFNWNWKAKNNE